MDSGSSRLKREFLGRILESTLEKREAKDSGLDPPGTESPEGSWQQQTLKNPTQLPWLEREHPNLLYFGPEATTQISKCSPLGLGGLVEAGICSHSVSSVESSQQKKD